MGGTIYRQPHRYRPMLVIFRWFFCHRHRFRCEQLPWCELQVVDVNCLAAAVALVWAGVGVTVWWKGHRAKLSNQLSSAWFIHDNTLTKVAKVNKGAQVLLTAVPLHIWTQLFLPSSMFFCLHSFNTAAPLPSGGHGHDVLWVVSDRTLEKDLHVWPLEHVLQTRAHVEGCALTDRG